MSKRFVTEKENILIKEDKIIVKGADVHHINVLRHKAGEKIFLNDYEIQITKLDKEILEGDIIGELPQNGVPKKEITLLQAYLKSDKMDYVVQKTVELGVKKIIPVITKNTIVKLDEKDKAKRIERLSKIAKEAVQQCGRTDMVIVENIEQLLNIDFDQFDSILICHETSRKSLKSVINDIKDVKNLAVIIGPEGGLDEKEVESILKNKKAIDISLGERILRAETASFNILSILGYEFD